MLSTGFGMDQDVYGMAFNQACVYGQRDIAVPRKQPFKGIAEELDFSASTSGLSAARNSSEYHYRMNKSGF